MSYVLQADCSADTQAETMPRREAKRVRGSNARPHPQGTRVRPGQARVCGGSCQATCGMLHAPWIPGDAGVSGTVACVSDSAAAAARGTVAAAVSVSRFSFWSTLHSRTSTIAEPPEQHERTWASPMPDLCLGSNDRARHGREQVCDPYIMCASRLNLHLHLAVSSNCSRVYCSK
jgi:hypothetical protein